MWKTLAVLLCLCSVASADPLSEARKRMQAELNPPAPKPAQVVEPDVPIKPYLKEDSEALSALKASEVIPVKATPKRILYVYTANWCAPCLVDHKAHEPEIAKGYQTCVVYIDVDQPANYRLQRQDGFNAIPAYIVKEDNKTVYRHQGQTPWSELAKALGPAPTEGEDTVTGAMEFGKLVGYRERVKAFLDFMNPLLQDNGTVSLSLGGMKSTVVEVTGAEVELPPNLKMDWRKVDGGVKVYFSPEPVVHYGILRQRVRGASIRPDKITLDLPWMLDGELGVE